MTLHMVSEDERREAAERLRDEVGYGSSWPGMERLGLILGVEREPRTGWEGRILTRLADIIDPECEEGRYEGIRTARAVDREALEMLAHLLIVTADGYQIDYPHTMRTRVAADGLRHFARSIYKALGEVVS